MNYYNATDYIKEVNEKRKGRNVYQYNLSAFLRSKKVKEVVKRYAGDRELIISKKGNNGCTYVAEPIMNLIFLALQTDNVPKINIRKYINDYLV